MITLTDQQIETIHKSVQGTGIRYYDVQLELVDHVASAIESNDERISFEQKLQLETKKWDEITLSQFVKSKESYLRNYWYRRAFGYLSTFFRPPVVLVTVILAAALFFLFTSFPHWTSYVSDASHVLYGIYVFSLCYSNYIGYGTKPLMVHKAYNETIASSYVLILGMHAFDIDEILINYSPLAYSILLALSLIVLYASVFVFPRWLHQEMNRYRLVV